MPQLTPSNPESPNNPVNYYDRSGTPSFANYYKTLFIAGKAGQSAEMNEMHDLLHGNFQTYQELFGQQNCIIQGGGISLTPFSSPTAAATTSGYFNWNGYILPFVSRSGMVVSNVGTYTIGIAVLETVVDYTIDPTLLNPAVGQSQYQTVGASRMNLVARMCLSSEALITEEFFPIFTVTNGALVSLASFVDINKILGADGTFGWYGNPIAPNCLTNSSGANGIVAWTDDSSAEITAVSQDATGNGSYFTAVATMSAGKYLKSGNIPVTAGDIYTLSADFYTLPITAGDIYANVYTSGNALLATMVPTLGENWSRQAVTFQIPVGISNIYVRFGSTSGATIASGYIGWRRLKLEKGYVPTPWTGELDFLTGAGVTGSLTGAEIASILGATFVENADFATSSTTAANLSGTPTLPDGTKATTQATADTSTELATDAFVHNVFATTSKLVWDSGALASSAQSATSPGVLTTAADGGYEFEFYIVNGYAGSNNFISLYFNGDGTSTDYTYALTGIASASAGAIIGGVNNTNQLFARIRGSIDVSPDGYASALIYASASYNTTDLPYGPGVVFKTATVTDIAYITIYATFANGLAANSRFRLWKRY